MEKKKVLLVDDVELFLHLGKTILRREDMDVQTATSGTEALEKARDMKPDVVLLDLYMPDRNGDAVCRDLKADPATAHIPVIMLTTGDDEAARERCLAAGCDEFVTKPIRAEAVHKAIEKHLKARLRRHPRARVEIVCTLSRGDRQEKGVIHTLSPYGAFVETAHEAPPGAVFEIRFQIPEDGTLVRSRAMVKWSRHILDSHPNGSGVEFEALDGRMFDRLSRYVDRILTGS